MVFSFLAAALQLPLTSVNAAEGLRDSTAACAAKNSGDVIEPRYVQGKAVLRAQQSIN